MCVAGEGSQSKRLSPMGSPTPSSQKLERHFISPQDDLLRELGLLDAVQEVGAASGGGLQAPVTPDTGCPAASTRVVRGKQGGKITPEVRRLDREVQAAQDQPASPSLTSPASPGMTNLIAMLRRLTCYTHAKTKRLLRLSLF